MPIASSLLQRKSPNAALSIATVRGDTSVLNAAILMNDRRIGAVPVLDDDGRIVGMFTERDIMTRVVAAQRCARETTVADVMTSPVIACGPDTTLDELRQVMQTQHIRHVPVVEDGTLLGMISIGDLNVAQVAVMTETISYLEQYMYKP